MRSELCKCCFQAPGVGIFVPSHCLCKQQKAEAVEHELDSQNKPVLAARATFKSFLPFFKNRAMECGLWGLDGRKGTAHSLCDLCVLQQLRLFC